MLVTHFRPHAVVVGGAKLKKNPADWLWKCIWSTARSNAPVSFRLAADNVYGAQRPKTRCRRRSRTLFADRKNSSTRLSRRMPRSADGVSSGDLTGDVGLQRARSVICRYGARGKLRAAKREWRRKTSRGDAAGYRLRQLTAGRRRHNSYSRDTAVVTAAACTSPLTAGPPVLRADWSSQSPTAAATPRNLAASYWCSGDDWRRLAANSIRTNTGVKNTGRGHYHHRNSYCS